ncbi:MAG TPA: hypothetical protein VNS55_14245 [Nocardioides sp.]|nr:hypothetical protein [Nocardioides sp.]
MEEAQESRSGPRSGGYRWTLAAILLVSAFVAHFVTIGADCLWLVTLGDHVRAHGIPDGLPFAAATTDGWPNAVVAAELVLSWVHELGLPGLAVLQVLASGAAMVVLALGARAEGASDAATARVLAVFAVGSVTALAIVRLQLFSLVPFAALLWLLRSQHRRPTRAIWLLPALVAAWTNLHGAVLLGVATAGAYLLFSRLRQRPAETVGVGALTLVALLATPAGLRTAAYYAGVFGNEAARRGTGLWARPSLERPFDVALALAALVLVVLAARHRLPAWEWVVLAGLTVATVSAARNGVWLTMWAVAPAARPALTALTARTSPAGAGAVARRGAAWFAALALSATTVLAVALVVPRGDGVARDDPDVVRVLAADVGDRVVLAPEPLAEALALEGATVWVADPVDAFEPDAQSAYLDFVDDGDPSAALPHVQAVVVETGSEAADRLAGLAGVRKVGEHGPWSVYDVG